jgi:hypothetical protein
LFQKNPDLSIANHRFRNDLISIFGSVYDFDTTHQYNQDASNFYDPIHYHPKLANELLNRFEQEQGYGTLLKGTQDAL